MEDTKGKKKKGIVKGVGIATGAAVAGVLGFLFLKNKKKKKQLIDKYSLICDNFIHKANEEDVYLSFVQQRLSGW